VNAAGVDVELEGPDGRYSLRCAHVVAADRTHSTVRTALGVGTSGTGDLGKSKINILFRADLRPHLRGMSLATCTITTPEAPGLLVTVDGESGPLMTQRSQACRRWSELAVAATSRSARPAITTPHDRRIRVDGL
jgi:2-polyprenyl-6-methoxyphenol hydroxylase-like FAD-dependent oxidoreductase